MNMCVLAAERQARDDAEVRRNRDATKQKRLEEKRIEEEHKRAKETRSYTSLFKDLDREGGGLVDSDIAPSADASASRAYEDDFM